LAVLLGHLVETVTCWKAGTQEMFGFQEGSSLFSVEYL
jgi:hypothetical protein